MHTKSYKSRKTSRNRSSPGDMTNTQTYIALPDEVPMTLSHFSVKACGPSSLKNGDMHFQNGQLSRNLTDILQLLEAFQRIISRLGTNWTCHIEKKFIQAKNTSKYLGHFLFSRFRTVQWRKGTQENKAKQDQGWNRTTGEQGRARAANNKVMKLQESMKEQ